MTELVSSRFPDRPDWWGYELAVPPPTIAYLNTVHSISGTFFTFLSTLTIAGGAPELQPFIRYISSFVDLEYKAILDQNKGKGVVLAATWVLVRLVSLSSTSVWQIIDASLDVFISAHRVSSQALGFP